MRIRAEISAGELVDKLTILEIKLDIIRDPGKRSNLSREYGSLLRSFRRNLAHFEGLPSLRDDLRSVNRELWRVEDDIRDCERSANFDGAFVALARSVYRSNDRRADLKRRINDLTQSEIVEEKSYAAY